MVDVVEEYDPEYEFFAPQYVNLLEAASEEALFDGADNWFDLEEKQSPIREQSYGKFVCNGDRTNKTLQETKLENSQLKLLNTTEPAQSPISPNSPSYLKEGFSSDKVTETEDIISNDNWASEKENKFREANNGTPISRQGLHKTERVELMKEKRLEKTVDQKQNHLSEIQATLKYMPRRTTNMENLKSTPNQNKENHNAKTVQSPSSHHAKPRNISRNNHQACSILAKEKISGATIFQTERRAILRKEKQNHTMESRPKANEPRTPVVAGSSWRPQVTVPHSPKFHSERRLRHCVERALKQNAPAGERSLNVVKQSATSLGLTVPESPSFRTQKRAETYYAQKRPPLSYESEQLKKIEKEREYLKKLIETGRKSCKKALRTVEETTEAHRISRQVTVPKTFTFATDERLARRKLFDLQSSENSNESQSKSSSTLHISTTRIENRQNRTPNNTKRTSLGSQNIPNNSHIARRASDSSSNTEKQQTLRSSGAVSGASTSRRNVEDVFTRLYQSRKRSDYSEPDGKKSSKPSTGFNRHASHPIISGSRAAPTIKGFLQGSRGPVNRATAKTNSECGSQSMNGPKYVFHSNSPINNKERRASRVPVRGTPTCSELETQVSVGG